MLTLNCTMRSSNITSRLLGFPRSRNICVRSKARRSVCPPIYEMKTALNEDRQIVLDFLHRNFYKDEPLRIGVPPSTEDPVDENFHLDNIARKTCILAVKPNDKIIGVLIAGVKKPYELENLAESHGGKFGKILKIWAKADRDSKIFKRFSVSRSLHAYLVAVDRNYRGYGVCKRLIEEMMTMGRRYKHEMVSIDATSIYAACACQRVNMNLVNTLVYGTYMDKGGLRIFAPPHPHDAIRTYVKRV